MNPELGLYYCFGCQESGDAITFVRKVEDLDFVDAVERLAAPRRHHAALRRPRSPRTARKKQRLAEAVAGAIDFYHELLLESADGGLARRYLRSPRLRR